MPGKVEVRYSLQDEASFTEDVCVATDKSESTFKTNSSATAGFLAFSRESTTEQYAFLNSMVVSTNTTTADTIKEAAVGDNSFGYKKSNLHSKMTTTFYSNDTKKIESSSSKQVYHLNGSVQSEAAERVSNIDEPQLGQSHEQLQQLLAIH
jgi:hypothetical protein